MTARINLPKKLFRSHFFTGCTIYQITITSQKMKFSIKDFFSKYDPIRSFLWIWSHLLKKSLLKSTIFWAVYTLSKYRVISCLCCHLFCDFFITLWIDSKHFQWTWTFPFTWTKTFRLKLETKESSQPAFTCSRLTIETLDQSVNYVQSEQ